MPAVPLMQVDAFASAAFRGNPAAVCWLESPRPAAWMQQVAAEMNLAETAFVEPRDDGFGLRWFTPAVEVDLCGHATVASAHALEVWGRLQPGTTARFLTRSGWLTAVRRQGQIELDFPARPVKPAPLPEGLAEALGLPAIVDCHLGPGALGDNYLLELADEATVRAVVPDFGAVAKLPLRSLTITSRGAAGSIFDCVSRFFAPRMGVNEDPVTGSAHTQLAPYWVERLGRNPLRAFQASPRGGELEIEVVGDRVKLRGHAVTVFQAELLV